VKFIEAIKEEAMAAWQAYRLRHHIARLRAIFIKAGKMDAVESCDKVEAIFRREGRL
jgi:hypothetical protein